MKRVLAIVAVATLTACGSASTTATTDSTAVTVDSTSVVTDTTSSTTTAPRAEKEVAEAVK